MFYRRLIFFLTIFFFFDLHAYQILEIDWSGETTNEVAYPGKNYNELVRFQSWGVGTRSNIVTPYREKKKLDGRDRIYPIETEYGYILNSKPVLRHYMDCGDKNQNYRIADRSEIHIKSTLTDFGIAEGSELWIGWSESYGYLDKTRPTTILQFRNQPTLNELRARQLESPSSFNWIHGGPATSISLKPVEGELHYHFEARSGMPNKWKIQPGRSFVLPWHIETKTTYYFILQIIYSRPKGKPSGRLRVWVYPEEEYSSEVAITDTPSVDIRGPTMYNWPDSASGEKPYSPEIRWGLYRYNCKPKNIKPSGKYPRIDESNRIMEKYLGPVKILPSQHENSFYFVKPNVSDR